MLTFVSTKNGKTKTIDLNVHACLQARHIEGISWNNIGQMEEPARTERFGRHCNVANLMDVRLTTEWADEARAYAEKGGHDVNEVLAVAVSTPRGATTTTPTTTPTASAPALPEVSESDIAGVLRKLERRAMESAVLSRIATQEMEMKARHYAEEQEMLAQHITAVKELQAAIADAETADDEDDGGAPPVTPDEDGATELSEEESPQPPEEGGEDNGGEAAPPAPTTDDDGDDEDDGGEQPPVTDDDADDDGDDEEDDDSGPRRIYHYDGRVNDENPEKSDDSDEKEDEIPF